MDLAFIIFLIAEGLLILLFAYLAWSWLIGTPYYPSSTHKLSEVLDRAEIVIKDNHNFVDVGSGDGRFVVWAAKKGMNSEGIEINPFLTLISRGKIALNRLKHKAKISNKNLFKHDYTPYDFVYLYQFPHIMHSIETKLLKELKPGSVIIANTFKLPNVKPDKVIDNFNIYIVK